MHWSSSICAVSSLVVIVFVMPQSSLFKVGGTAVPAGRENFNKTLRDHIIKQRWFERVKQIMNLGDQSPATKSTKTPRENEQFMVTNTLTTDLLPKQLELFQNVYHSEIVAKNVLKFRLRNETINNRPNVTKINLYIYVQMKEPSAPASRDLSKKKNGKKAKSKTIKIEGFLVDSQGNRMQSVGTLRRTVIGSNWEKMPLPLYLINAAAEPDGDNTFRLKIECKRCKNRAQLYIPNSTGSSCKSQRRLRKKKKRCDKGANPVIDQKKVPFIYIEEKTIFGGGRRKRASKPSAVSHHHYSDCTNETGAQTLENANGSADCCMSVKSYIELSDLKLDDVIVAPTGFDFVTCTGTCSKTALSLPHHKKLHSKHVQHRTSQIIQQLRHSSKTTQFPSVTPSSAREKRHSQGQETKNDDVLQNPKWGRLKVGRACAPVETENLVLLHFSHDQNLVMSQIPNFLVSRCGCDGQLPSLQ